KEHAWKACVGEILPWVRIPPSPPEFLVLPYILFLSGIPFCNWLLYRLASDHEVSGGLSFGLQSCPFEAHLRDMTTARGDNGASEILAKGFCGDLPFVPGVASASAGNCHCSPGLRRNDASGRGSQNLREQRQTLPGPER